jgi:carbon storage regulator
LVIRRRAGESLLVGAGVEIEILEISGTRVKLGIVAPDSVLIQRKETQLTRDENIVAARSVRQRNISSLLDKLAVPQAAPTKKEANGPNQVASEMYLVVGGKNIRTAQGRPRYE